MHELLMALAGYPGDVFVWSGKDAHDAGCSFLLHAEEQGFRVNPEIETLSQAEREVLESAVKSGYDFALVKRFVETVRSSTCWDVASEAFRKGGKEETRRTSVASSGAADCPDTAAPRRWLSGLYVGAVARAAHEMMGDYTEALLRAEGCVLQQPLTPVSAVSMAMSFEAHKMCVLRRAITKVRKRRRFLFPSSPLASSTSFLQCLGGGGFGERMREARRFRESFLQIVAMAEASAASGGCVPCGPVLDFLWKGRLSGDPGTREVFGRLLAACARIFAFQVRLRGFRPVCEALRGKRRRFLFFGLRRARVSLRAAVFAAFFVASVWPAL